MFCFIIVVTSDIMIHMCHNCPKDQVTVKIRYWIKGRCDWSCDSVASLLGDNYMLLLLYWIYLTPINRDPTTVPNTMRVTYVFIIYFKTGAAAEHASRHLHIFKYMQKQHRQPNIYWSMSPLGCLVTWWMRFLSVNAKVVSTTDVQFEWLHRSKLSVSKTHTMTSQMI